MSFKPGEGLYAELGDDGKLKDPIMTKDPGVGKDTFKDTGQDLTSEQKKSIEGGGSGSGYVISRTSRSKRRSRPSRPDPVLEVEEKVPEPVVPKSPDVSSRQDVDRFNREVDVYNRDLKAYQEQFTRPDGFRPGESLYLELGRDGLKDDVLVKDGGSTLRRSGLSIDAKQFEKDIEDANKEARENKITEARESRRSIREATKPDPNKQLFGKREPGKETVSSAPTYNVYDPAKDKTRSGLSATQTAEFLAVRTFLPKYWGITTEDYKQDIYDFGSPARVLSETGDKIITEFKNIKAEDMYKPKGFREGQSLTVGLFDAFGKQETAEFYREREAKWMKLSEKAVEGLVKFVSVTGQVIGETVKDPVRAVALFAVGGGAGKIVKVLKPVAVRYSAWVGSRSVPVRSALRGAGIGLKTTAVGVIGGSVVMDVARADDPALRTAQITKDFVLLGAGFRAGQRTTIKFPSFKKSPDLTVRGTGAEWRLKTTVQGRDVQTTLTGQTTTPQQIYETRLSAGAPSLKKSPLGLDNTPFYSSQVRLGKGSSNVLFEKSFGQSFAYPRFSSTESGQSVLTDFKVVGTKTQSLKKTSVRLMDKITGKEYNVLVEQVQKRLAQNPDLEVVGQPARYLFASDPLTALATMIKPVDFKITPQLSTRGVASSPSPVSILKPKPVMSPSLQPLLITPSLLTRKDEGVVGLVEEQQKQRDETQSISITPVFLSQRKNIELMSTATFTETSSVSDSITSSSSRSVTRSSSKSMIDTVQTPISETITQQVQSSTTTPKNILRQPSFNPQNIKSSSLTRPSLGFPSGGRAPSLGAGFVVSVRRSGVFSPVGFFSTPEEAFSKGVKVVSGSAGASFKVSDPKGEVVPFSSFSIGNRFRPSKTERGVVVERRRYRISSPGELEEITYKGLMSQKRKRGGGGFNLF